jgi:hypothetical protein
MKKYHGFLLAALIPLLASCSVFWNRDNPVDPGNTSDEHETEYQGYTTVASSSEIEVVQPKNGEHIGSYCMLIFSEVKGAVEYEFVMADSVSKLDTSPDYRELLDAYEYHYFYASSLPSNLYYWKVRARFSSGWDTTWSPVFNFYY